MHSTHIINSSLLKTVARRLKEIQVNKKTNKTNKISKVKNHIANKMEV